MAPQDYVSRPPNKKKSPYNKGKAKQPQGITHKFKLVVLITSLALVGFAYFLWSIKNTTVITEKTTPIVEEKSKTTLPSPPTEKWSYRKELEDKKIEIGQYNVKQGGPYKMQCGSFKNLEQAEILKANIAFTGLSATIGKSTSPSSTYYKVYLGPYAKKRDAEKDKHKLKRNKINYCQIWLWK